MQNFEAARGDNFDLSLALVDGSGDAIDVTDYEFELILKRRKEQADDHADAVSFDGSIVDGPAGLAAINLDDTDTEDLSGSYFYRVKYTDGDGAVRRIMEGAITFSEIVVASVSPSATIAVSENSVTVTVSNLGGTSIAFQVEKFSRTVTAGYTTLTANQLAGSAAIPLAFPARSNSIAILRNGIALEVGVEFTIGANRDQFTLVGSYDTTDKFEVRYAKS